MCNVYNAGPPPVVRPRRVVENLRQYPISQRYLHTLRYWNCKYCTVVRRNAAAKTAPSPPKSNFINRLSTSIRGLVLENLLTRELFISAQPTCNHEDISCCDYCSSDTFPPLWSYAVIAFVQPYKSRPQKTTVTKHVFITSDASDNDSYCWLSVGTERYLLTFRKIKAPSVNSVTNITQIYNPKCWC